MKNSKLLSYVISILLIIVSFVMTVRLCCFDTAFYAKEHRSLKLYGQPLNEYMEISYEELDDLTEFVLDYLNDSDKTLDKMMNIRGTYREVFTEDEKTHMVDVRNLYKTALFIGLISCICLSVLLVYYVYNKMSLTLLFKSYCRTLFVVALIILVLALFIFTDFSTFWDTFHRIFFAGNQLWILSLTRDILIMIVPPEFFFHLVTKIVFSFLASIVSILVILMIVSRSTVK